MRSNLNFEVIGKVNMPINTEIVKKSFFAVCKKILVTKIPKFAMFITSVFSPNVFIKKVSKN